jgi:succinate dehydrogenase / fumarate reductase, cytochrome b subunit
MEASIGFMSSLVGRKIVMAATGIVLIGFVFGHMVGNLQVYMGPEALDAYAEFLQTFLHGGGIWIARASLATAVVLHVWAAVSLTLESRRARPLGYRVQDWRESTYASRTMIWGGLILAGFVTYHIMHFTLGTCHSDFRPGEVYHNVVSGFQFVPASIVYIVSMLALGLHMYHGVSSMFQTLGLNHPAWNGLRALIGFGLTGLVVLGNISIPVSVMMGWVR